MSIGGFKDIADIKDLFVFSKFSTLKTQTSRGVKYEDKEQIFQSHFLWYVTMRCTVTFGRRCTPQVNGFWFESQLESFRVELSSLDFLQLLQFSSLIQKHAVFG